MYDKVSALVKRLERLFPKRDVAIDIHIASWRKGPLYFLYVAEGYGRFFSSLGKLESFINEKALLFKRF